MLRRVATGKGNDECYSVLWKAPNGTHQITGVRDNEREEFYDIYNVEDVIEFVRLLNIKESIRSENYNNICKSFEKELRQAEDRYLEQYKVNKELEQKLGTVTGESSGKQVFTIGNICKEVQRIQFDLEQYGDITSAIDRCKGLDDLLCRIEDGEYDLEI